MRYTLWDSFIGKHSCEVYGVKCNDCEDLFQSILYPHFTQSYDLYHIHFMPLNYYSRKPSFPLDPREIVQNPLFATMVDVFDGVVVEICFFLFTSNVHILVLFSVTE